MLRLHRECPKTGPPNMNDETLGMMERLVILERICLHAVRIRGCTVRKDSSEGSATLRHLSGLGPGDT